MNYLSDFIRKLKIFWSKHSSNYLLKKTLIYTVNILILSFLTALIFYTLSKKQNHSFNYILSNTIFFINTPIVAYALLALVAERGLFNGIRYSTKQFMATVSKKHRFQLMEENNIRNQLKLKEMLKERYLYHSPHYSSTKPLVISSLLIFIIHAFLALILIR